MKKIEALTIAVVRRLYPNWTDRIEDWAEARQKLSEARERWKDELFGFAFDLGRSPLFTLVRCPLFRQEIRGYREGVTVTATYRGGILPLRPALEAAALFFLMMSLTLSTLPGALSLISPLALLACAWCVFPLWIFQFVFYRGNFLISEQLHGFIMDAGLYREEIGPAESGECAVERRIVASIRLMYFMPRGGSVIVRAFNDATWHKQASELDALGISHALHRDLVSKVKSATHTDYYF